MTYNIAPLVIAAIISVAVPSAEAQTLEPKRAQHTVFLELGGSSLLYSLNYDYRIAQRVSLRAGGFFIPPRGEDFGAFGGPALVNLILLDGRHQIEIGAGVTVFAPFGSAECGRLETCPDDPFMTGATGAIGYRYQPFGGGRFFRLSYVPLYSFQDGFMSWAGVSFGITL